MEVWEKKCLKLYPVFEKEVIDNRCIPQEV